jgi:hypothetical protein
MIHLVHYYLAADADANTNTVIETHLISSQKPRRANAIFNYLIHMIHNYKD